MKESLFKKIEDSDFEIVDGDRGSNYPNQAELKETGYCLFLSANNVTKEGFKFSNCNYITLEKDNKLRKGKLKYEDIIITTRGTIGNIVYYHKEIPLENIRINSGMIILRKKNYDVCSRFFYYVLKSKFTREQFDLFTSGTAQPQLPIKDFKKIKIPYPCLEVQKQIASILSVYDDLIDVNTQRIKLLEETAKELYKEWFIRMRFPGSKSTRFEKGVPDGWEIKKVSQAFEVVGGGTPSTDKEEYWNGTVNWFTPTDITNSSGIFLDKSKSTISEEGLKGSSAKLFPPYTVMMTSRATIGAVGINSCVGCTNQGFITCLPNDRIPYTFLYHWINANKETFEMLASGSTFLEITKGTFKKINILLPEKGLLRQFHKQVDPIFKQIENLQQQNTELRQIRDRLLPRLISGKLKVKIAEETPCL